MFFLYLFVCFMIILTHYLSFLFSIFFPFQALYSSFYSQLPYLFNTSLPASSPLPSVAFGWCRVTVGLRWLSVIGEVRQVWRPGTWSVTADTHAQAPSGGHTGVPLASYIGWWGHCAHVPLTLLGPLISIVAPLFKYPSHNRPPYHQRPPLHAENIFQL